MELHHIQQVADGGKDIFENCIPLCFDCHSDVGSYNSNHPKGRKYSSIELTGHRDNWYAKTGNSFTEPIGIPQEIAIVISPSESSLNKSPFGNDLVPLLLIGAWCESLNNDQLIAAQVCGDNLSEWKKSLKDILILENSPISMKGNTWKLHNHIDAWEEFAPRITDSDLDLLEKIAIAVITESNPKYELARNERWYSNVLGKNLSYSSALRKGLATSLAWIGSNHQKLIHCTANKAEVMPILCMREIFKESGWQLWASFGDLLPILAEAAPDAFLDAIEAGLNSELNPFLELFGQEGANLTDTNDMCWLLWALEALAWEERWIPRVTSILGVLASIDPGGNWGNRPDKSLKEIFLPWHTQTLASWEKQYAAIRILINENPNTAWDVLSAFIPNKTQTTMGTNKPKYRMTIADDWKPSITMDKYWERIEAFSNLLIQLATDNPIRIRRLVELLDNLSRESLSSALKCIKSSINCFTNDEKIVLWEDMFELVSKHEKYADTDWAMKQDALTPIKDTIKLLSPTHPTGIYRRLFAKSDFDLYEERNTDWREQETLLLKRRTDGLSEIIALCGVNSLVNFVESVEAPEKVGRALA
jgi:hypothetical protein